MDPVGSARTQLPGDDAADPRVGRRTSLVFEVLGVDTAESLGSGVLPVLATPRLLTWLERACVAVVESSLEPGQATVGVRAEVDHLAASAVGTRVTVTARIVGVTDRRIRFDVEATHPDGSVVARGRLDRAAVHRQRFLSRLS